MICLRSPWPADTGGARDMLDRLKALHQNGIQVHLHYFTKKNKSPREELTPYCKSIYTYTRKTSWSRMLKGQPYIVACRSSQVLLDRLQNDNAPILFDGIHTTCFIGQLSVNNRKLVVRMHNDEVNYYRSLASFEKNPFRRLYLEWESICIGRWIRNLPKNTQLGCIQQRECDQLSRKHPHLKFFLLPPVIPGKVLTATGTGGYCLFHGNLSIRENESAAIWLLRRVFASIKLPLVIAGKSPSPRLEKLVHFYQHACLVADPTTDELTDLIRKAQINVLPSRTRTGIKLKIFDALTHGRHCIINQEMSDSSPWTDSCVIGQDARDMANKIEALYKKPFTLDMIRLREEKLAYWRTQLDPVDELIKRLW